MPTARNIVPSPPHPPPFSISVPSVYKSWRREFESFVSMFCSFSQQHSLQQRVGGGRGKEKPPCIFDLAPLGAQQQWIDGYHEPGQREKVPPRLRTAAVPSFHALPLPSPLPQTYGRLLELPQTTHNQITHNHPTHNTQRHQL
ncbi:unnamed protein product, partial [Ectocarpus sp. 12 AP-2014]